MSNADFEPAVIELARSIAAAKPPERQEAYINALLTDLRRRGLCTIDAIVEYEAAQIEKEVYG